MGEESEIKGSFRVQTRVSLASVIVVLYVVLGVGAKLGFISERERERGEMELIVLTGDERSAS